MPEKARATNKEAALEHPGHVVPPEVELAVYRPDP